MPDVTVRVDPTVLDELAGDEESLDLAQQAGDRVAERAAQLAPSRTGAGAASIYAEVDTDSDGAYADVSWDVDHFYMGFAELGTEHQAAQPFLRPALDQVEV